MRCACAVHVVCMRRASHDACKRSSMVRTGQPAGGAPTCTAHAFWPVHTQLRSILCSPMLLLGA